jgi:hypothetical protein
LLIWSGGASKFQARREQTPAVSPLQMAYPWGQLPAQMGTVGPPFGCNRGAQVPSACPVVACAHPWQARVHVPEQHTPSTQPPAVVHWLPPAQVAPAPPLGVQIPLASVQKNPLMQFASAVHLDMQLPPEQMKGDTQSEFARQVSLQAVPEQIRFLSQAAGGA